MVNPNEIRHALKLRRKEIEHYQLEVTVCDKELELLAADGVPDDWPENLERYRGRSRDEVIRMMASCPLDELQVVFNLNARDQLVGQKRAALLELQTCERRLRALESQLPPEDDGVYKNALQRGLATLQDMVADPQNDYQSFAVDHATLVTTDTGGLGRVGLVDSQGKTHLFVVAIDDDDVQVVPSLP